MNGMVYQNYQLPCSPTHLGHQQEISLIGMASYLKMQLAILGVIDCLRSICNPKPSPLDEAVDRKLLSLNHIISGLFGRSA